RFRRGVELLLVLARIRRFVEPSLLVVLNKSPIPLARRARSFDLLGPVAHDLAPRPKGRFPIRMIALGCVALGDRNRPPGTGQRRLRAVVPMNRALLTWREGRTRSPKPCGVPPPTVRRLAGYLPRSGGAAAGIAVA